MLHLRKSLDHALLGTLTPAVEELWRDALAAADLGCVALPFGLEDQLGDPTS
ncbi:MAG: hypothetical protein NTZ90_11530 [Proteobacteria bacterium]|nr:hypothetical protein [Pseudomonadota bacterium]